MSAPQVTATIALVGSPNSGKTTLFNWLTGSKFKAVNYAGSTVDAHRGSTLPVYGELLTVLDTPGVYSLQPHGRDEEVTLETLIGNDLVRAVVVVIDGTQLNRQLYLVRQICELRLPMVLAVTMVDIVKQSGRRLDLAALSELVGAPVVAVDGRLGGGVAEVVQAARIQAQILPPSKRLPIQWADARIEAEIAVSEAWTRRVVVQAPGQDMLYRLRRWDAVLLHPVWGLGLFVVIMGALFSSIFWLASPVMDLIDYLFTQAAQYSHAQLGAGALGDFIGNGIISGIGAVLVFVPQIFVLFLFFTLLEDSGYLARAATIVDRPLNYLGLSGRAFVPILSGFACAVPAIMACRNIRSARERWMTIFIIPFMTCSARLPVYTLLLTFVFFGRPRVYAGLALTALYLGGLVLGAIAAALMNRILRGQSDSHFLMELPIYRWPKPIFTLKIAVRRTRSYLVKAGPTIFAFILLLWIGTHFPYDSSASAAEQLQHSVIGRVGRAIEPVFRPMGLDWRVGLGMMSAFVAREVFVSSLAVIFNIADSGGDSLQHSLLERMRDAQLPDHTPLFTVASVTGLIVYFMIALQCLSTSSVTWREMGSFKYAIVQLIAFNVFAYGAAVAVTQTLQAFS